MPKVSEEHAVARRRQIVEAANRCFARQGFHRTTMQDIFREAELSPGAVYTYFFGKEDLIRAIADEGLSMARRMFTGAGGATLDEVFAQIMGVFDALESGDALGIRTSIQLWAEALRDPKLMALLHRSIDHELEQLEQVVAGAQERGELDPSLDPGGVARATIALFHGLMVQRAWYPRMDVTEYRAAATAMVAGLRPVRPA
jgi:AcrR family transcriptional regulator